ncbi:sugar transport protein 13-like [Cryptomeria japonica]|uniref:sugar transport protein 13-like n=1 Tax=Cryptomeria japonica TaxID=3369 RepID=UPI0027D9FCAA|nr:sugar transport protein 13-like [Cryptomeria japonica]
MEESPKENYVATKTQRLRFPSTFVSIYSVDKVGRRVLLLEAGVQMFVSQVIIGILLAIGMKEDKDISKGMAIVIVLMAFLSMLCHFKYGIFLFFASWVLIMSTFVLFLLPETKNVPIEEMIEKVWRQHSLWKKYVTDSDLIDDEDGDAYSNQETGKANGKAHHNSQL